MRKTLFLLFIQTIISWNFLWAQPICQVTHYTMDEGLSQEVVQDILQDYRGYMWFSTWNGLNRFDGYSFKAYKAYPGDGNNLNTNRIDIIKEGGQNYIWCRSYDRRAYLFNNTTEKFTDVLSGIEKELKQVCTIDQIYPLKNGYTWITGRNGFCFRINEKLAEKGEGVEFYGVYNDRLKGKTIYDIVTDSDGDEWVLTDRGITIVGRKEIQSDFPFNHFLEKDHIVWLASSSGVLASYNKNNGSLDFMTLPSSINRINTLYGLDSETMGIGTNSGLLLFKAEDHSLRLVDIRQSGQPSNNVSGIYKDSYGELWLTSASPGVTRFNPVTGELQHLYTPVEEGRSHNRYLIYEDNNRNLWLTPRLGYFCYYDRKDKVLKYVYEEPGKVDTRINPLIRKHISDRQGNLWINTLRGVYKLSFFDRTYEMLDPDSGREIRAFMIDSHKRNWFASKSGKIGVNDVNNNFIGFLSDKGEITSNSSVWLSLDAYSMMEDKEGNIWLGTKDKGICYLKKNKENKNNYQVQFFKPDPNNPYSLSNESVYSIFQDNRDRIWIGTYGGGLNLVDKNEEGEIIFIHSGNILKNFPSLYCSKIRYIAEINQEILMVGTTDGLLSFSIDFRQPGEIKFYRNIRRANEEHSLSNNDVMHICETSVGDIYLSTSSGGINKIISENLLSETIQFRAWAEREGMISDLALSMIEDKGGIIWVILENGLSRFYPEEERFDNFGRHFFHRRFTFSEAIPVVNEKGSILLGMTDGVMKLNPKDLVKSKDIPPIAFTEIKIHNALSDYNIDNLDILSLKPSERNISIQFAALDFIDAEEVNYAYMLEGLDREWNYVKDARLASYINLPKGKYRFMVKSTNSDGVWVDNMRALEINVIPTFWETVWAWIFYLSSLIILVSTIVYVLLYIYKLRHQVNVEQQLANIKLRFFTDISHELRTPLTLISSPVSEVLENEPLSEDAKDSLLLVQKNTNRMLNLVNEILDFRKIQNNKMKLLIEETEVISFLTAISDSFRFLAEEKHIFYNFSYPVEQLNLWVDKVKFEKIFFNLLSNAFKYTPEGKSIQVKIVMSEKEVSIHVIDEGIGINQNEQKTLFQRFETLVNQNILEPSSGIGLSLVKELVEMHHATIEVLSEPQKGSEFIVTFQRGSNHFKTDPHAEFILADVDSVSPDIPTSDVYLNEKETGLTEGEEFTILIVEDNKELKRFLKKILSRNYHVVEAEDGKEGLEKAIESVPDLIISDVMMPVMDGLDMVKTIKENKDICHIPIILLSAKSSLDDRIKGLEYGIDDYITKPFSSSYLKARIVNLMKRRMELQHRYMDELTSKGAVSVSSLTPAQPQITSQDEEFLEEVMAFMEKNMDNTEVTIDEFANSMAMSRTIFYKKIKSIVGLSPVEFIREIRIKRAVQLMDSGEYNIAQVAYMTGFNDPKYFSKCFKKQTGYTPSEYQGKKSE